MPNMVAHIYFGGEVLNELPAEIKNICEKYRDAFDFGTIGPDFLFALREIGDSSKRYTNIMQSCRVYDTFRSIAGRLAANPDSREISYVMGLLCHYVSDFNIHPYVYFFTEQGFAKEVPLLSKPHVHALIEAAFDEYTACELRKDPYYNPGRNLKTSRATRKAIADLYYNAVNKVVGLDTPKYKIRFAATATRMFANFASDHTGKKRKLLKLIEEKILKKRLITIVMRPPWGYGDLDYLNFSHKPFRAVRDKDTLSTLSYPELAEKAKKQAVEYITKFYKAIRAGGSLEPMGGYEAFSISYEGTTNIR